MKSRYRPRAYQHLPSVSELLAWLALCGAVSLIIVVLTDPPSGLWLFAKVGNVLK